MKQMNADKNDPQIMQMGADRESSENHLRKSALSAESYNPDVLSCLANLSSDEVFTPPQLANNMLDLLPADLWIDRNATFLDPCCKTGVFLRDTGQ